MFKQLKQDKKIKDLSFKQMNSSKQTFNLESINDDTVDKLNYSIAKPKKKPPKEEDMFGSTPIAKKKQKKKKVQKNKANIMKKVKRKTGAFKY